MSKEYLIKTLLDKYTNIIIPSIAAAIIIIDLYILIKGRKILKGSVAIYCKFQIIFVFLHSVAYVRVG